MILRIPNSMALRRLAWMTLLTVLTGCGGQKNGPLPPTDVTAPIDALADVAGDVKKIPCLFVSGAAPGDAVRRRYAQLMFSCLRVRQISDTEAEVHVLIEDGSGKSLGEADWVVAKTRDVWQLKSAPLPGG
jgi:predicted small lipoprotein YifL